MFIEIPKPKNIHDEIIGLTSKINEYRIIIRRSFFNLDSKIRPYYAPKEVRLIDEVKFQNDFDGLGNPKSDGKGLVNSKNLKKSTFHVLKKSTC